MNPNPAPQQNPNAAPQQNQQYEQAKQQILSQVKQAGIDPRMAIKIGDMAEQAIPNKQMHQQVMQAAMQAGLAEADDFQGMAVYQTLGTLAAIGKVLKESQGGVPNA